MDEAVRHHERHRPAHATLRTCLGCRRRDERSALVRVVAVRVAAGAEGQQNASSVQVVPDERRRLPGRGAWLHPTPTCLEHAIRRNAFGRALRVRGRPDVGPVQAWFEQHTP